MILLKYSYNSRSHLQRTSSSSAAAAATTLATAAAAATSAAAAAAAASKANFDFLEENLMCGICQVICLSLFPLYWLFLFFVSELPLCFLFVINCFSSNFLLFR